MKLFAKNNQILIFVTILCFSGFVLFATLLFTGQSFVRSKRTVVAKVFECNQNVKIRRSSGNSWLSCENETLLFDGDWISTKKLSVNLQLKDGRNIFVGNNSALQIQSPKRKKINIDLTLGRVFVRPWSNSKYKLRLRAGTEYFKISKGSDFVEVSLNKNGETNLINQRMGSFSH